MSPVAQVPQFPRVQAVRNWSRSHSCTRRIRAWTRSLSSLSWRRYRTPWSISIVILHLQYIDKVVDVCCAGPASSCEVVGDGRDPTVAARFLLDRLLLARCVQRQMPSVDVLRISSTVVYVPVIMRDSGSAPDSGHREFVDIPARNRDRCSTFISGLMAAMSGFSAHFASFFALLRCPRVERQFFELLSAHNCECSRAPGGARVSGSLTPK